MTLRGRAAALSGTRHTTGVSRTDGTTKGCQMGQDNGWLPESPGTAVVLTDPLGQRVEGFLEQVDPGLGVAWIRERQTGERRMLSRADYPHILHG